jgi:hypothetical protein
MFTFSTDIEFGERYRDTTSGFEGVADAISFSRFGCPRVKLRAMVSNVPVEHWIDEGALEHRVNGTTVGFGKDGCDQ